MLSFLQNAAYLVLSQDDSITGNQPLRYPWGCQVSR